MFPTDTNFTLNTNKNEQPAKLGRSFLFDFATGRHVVIDGKLQETTQLQAVKQWLELLLITTVDKYRVYQDTGFGTTWERHISYRNIPLGFITSEIEREITEAATTLNPAIDTIRDFTAVRTTRGLTVSFTAVLKDAQLLEVNANV